MYKMVYLYYHAWQNKNNSQQSVYNLFVFWGQLWNTAQYNYVQGKERLGWEIIVV